MTSCVLGTPRAGRWSGHSSAEWGWDTASGTEPSVGGRGGVALQGAEQQETGLQLGGCLPPPQARSLEKVLFDTPAPPWLEAGGLAGRQPVPPREVSLPQVGGPRDRLLPASVSPFLAGWEMVVKTSGPSILFPSAPPHVGTRGGSAGGPLGCVSSSPLMPLLDSLTWDWKQGGPDPVDLGAPFPWGQPCQEHPGPAPGGK